MIALIECPNCKNNASLFAACCPHCAHPFNFREIVSGPILVELPLPGCVEHSTDRLHNNWRIIYYYCDLLKVFVAYSYQKLDTDGHWKPHGNVRSGIPTSSGWIGCDAESAASWTIYCGRCSNDVNLRHVYDRMTRENYSPYYCSACKNTQLLFPSYRTTEDKYAHWIKLKLPAKSGCFLTSACFASLQHPFAREYLQVFRDFRDNYVSARQRGGELICEYYRLAPSLVNAIESSDTRADEYRKMMDVLIEPCYQLIKNMMFEEALALFERYFTELQQDLYVEDAYRVGSQGLVS